MEMVEDEESFVIVLIGKCSWIVDWLAADRLPDEVESLTAARAGAMAGTEPSDALRVGLMIFKPKMLCLIYLTAGRQCSIDPARQAKAQKELSGYVNEQSPHSDWYVTFCLTLTFPSH